VTESKSATVADARGHREADPLEELAGRAESRPVREELAHDLLAGELARFVSKSTAVLVAMEI
jgi:hypothetical protein